MIQIKTQELRDAVQDAYEFDGKTRTYYFDDNKLFAYEDVV